MRSWFQRAVGWRFDRRLEESQRELRFFHALHRAVLAVARAEAPEQVYGAVSSALHSLGIQVNVFAVEEGRANLLLHTYPTALVQKVKQLTGQGHRYSVAIGRIRAFRDIVDALDHAAAAVPAPPRGDHDWRGTGTILVVDDEALVRRAAERMLDGLGLSVMTASDGADAIAIFRERHDEIACVLLDLKMPRMDGKETLDELRRISTTVPVILSSGFSEQDSTADLGELGLAGFIQKPYTSDGLKEVLRDVVGKST